MALNVLLPSCHWAAAAAIASSASFSSCPYTACSGTRPGSPAGLGRSSQQAAPSLGRRASGWRCSKSAVCAAASRLALSGRGWSFPAVCGREAVARAAGPRLVLLLRKDGKEAKES